MAHRIQENLVSNLDVEPENYPEYYILTKFLSGNDHELHDLAGYIEGLGLRAMPFYHTYGQYETADSLAKVYDAKFLGPSILLRYISINPLFFHLSATPNFSARLKELGIDPVKYEEDQYLKLPAVH